MPEEAGEWRRGGRGVTGQVTPEEGISLHISEFNMDPQPQTSSSLSLLKIKPSSGVVYLSFMCPPEDATL